MIVSDINPDAPCGQFFRYRDLIACGDTFHKLAAGWPEGIIPPEYLPTEIETWSAIEQLCVDILDPLQEKFGSVRLTYAFASPVLTRQIRRGIAPRLDQHVGSEKRDDGSLICPRQGMAADLLLPGVPSSDIARWILDWTKFDRLYFYGNNRAIHVSIGPARKGVAYTMKSMGGNKLIPVPGILNV